MTEAWRVIIAEYLWLVMVGRVGTLFYRWAYVTVWPVGALSETEVYLSFLSLQCCVWLVRTQGLLFLPLPTVRLAPPTPWLLKETWPESSTLASPFFQAHDQVIESHFLSHRNCTQHTPAFLILHGQLIEMVFTNRSTQTPQHYLFMPHGG